MSNYSDGSKNSQRILGLFLLVFSIAVTVWLSKLELSKSFITIMAQMLFPAISVVGLGLILFPIDQDELEKRWGVRKIESIGQIPGIWWGIIIFSILLGIGSYLVFS